VSGRNARTLRIGAGASYAGDRVEPATEIAARGGSSRDLGDGADYRTVLAVAFPHDQVQVLAGPNRGKTGRVLIVKPREGKVVVEGVKKGQELTGWIMEDDKEIRMTAKSDIPIGHKLALKDYKPGDTVIKYGIDIGKVVAPIARGEHTHVQNLKTKRW